MELRKVFQENVAVASDAEVVGSVPVAVEN
jgi:hypothetical protein